MTIELPTTIQVRLHITVSDHWGQKNMRDWVVAERNGRNKMSHPRKSRIRRLRGLERLELRAVMDAAAVTLGVDSFRVDQDSPNQLLDVLANDVFPADYAGERKITSVSLGDRGGELLISADGRSVIYSPLPGYTSVETFNRSEEESFLYIVDNEYSAKATVNVLALVKLDSFSVWQNAAARELPVLVNDRLVNSQLGPGIITAVSSTTQDGTVEIRADGKSLLYTPAKSFVGTEKFSYVVDGTYEAPVTVEVFTKTHPDNYSVVRNSPATTLAVAENDCFEFSLNNPQRLCDPVDITSITAVEQPDHGTVRISDDGLQLIYTPATDFTGSASFTYYADNQFAARVDVNVIPPNDSFTVTRNSSHNELAVLENDLFPPDYVGERRITKIDGSDYGDAQMASDGKTLLFTPKTDFLGTVGWTYTVDGVYSATVAIVVQQIAFDDFDKTTESSARSELAVLSNDRFPSDYQGAKKITEVSSSQHEALVSISDDGKRVQYQPASGFKGVDWFTYTVDGEHTATVRIQVDAVAQNDTTWVDQYTGGNLINVLYNDNRTEKRITSVGTPSHGGTVELDPVRQMLLYTPAPDFNGTEEFTYTLNDEFTATVSANVSRLKPNKFYTAKQNADSVFAPLVNDTFPQNYLGNQKVTAVGPSEKGGTVRLDPETQTIAYSPPTDFFGTDHFTFTIDGHVTTDVQVNVVRVLRDDRYHVAVNSNANLLTVLINDDFGPLYGGDQRITSVSATESGGTVAIAPDGTSLIYTPKSGHSGPDQFTYQVDGQYVATVRVTVSDQRANIQRAFSSADELTQTILDVGLAQYEYLFGKEQPDDRVAYASTGSVRIESDAAISHSETNVQVAGVDEGDIVETDGNYVYVLTGQELVIVDSFPAVESHVESRYKFQGTPAAQFLHGDLLTVISHTKKLSPWWGRGDFYFGGWLPPPSYSGVTVTVLNIQDRTAPELISETQLDGDYFESRAIGDHVYIVARSSLLPPTPELVCRPMTEEERTLRIAESSSWYPVPNDDFEKCIYETQEQYTARAASFTNTVLPHYTSYGGDGNIVRSGLLIDVDDLYGERSPSRSNIYSMIAFNIASSDPGPVSTLGIMAGTEATLFASQHDIYLLDKQWRGTVEDKSFTNVWQVRLDKSSGDIQPVATGELPGSVINQFSVDEHNGLLRVATTTWSDTASSSDNNVFVLQEDFGEFEMIGSLQNLAPNETIFGVRFFGERAIVVTFRRIDPLFTIDLSDPANPKAAAALKLPGFSTYIQPIDANHILTFGRGGPTGWDGPPQVSLFDISDIDYPLLIDKAPVGRRHWSEDAWEDHHAVSYFPEDQVLAIPFNQYTSNWTNGYYPTETQLFIFKIDVGQTAASDLGIQQLEVLTNPSLTLRSVRIEDALYSISQTELQIVDISHPKVKLGSVSLASEDTGNEPEISIVSVEAQLRLSRESPTPFDDPVLGKVVFAAQTKLAEQFDVPEEAAVLVTVERDREASGGSDFRVVLRLNDKQYLYHSDDRGGASQIAADFEFANSNGHTWHNANIAYDTNGDNYVSPMDAMIIINDLNLHGPRVLKQWGPVRAIIPGEATVALFRIDVNNDGFAAPGDLLLIINELNRQARPAAEGEGFEDDSSDILLAAHPSDIDQVIRDLPLIAAFRDNSQHLTSDATEELTDVATRRTAFKELLAFSQSLVSTAAAKRAGGTTFNESDWSALHDVALEDLLAEPCAGF